MSYFEVGLADCLRYYLTHFPQKLKGEELKFPKDRFVREQFSLLEHAIDAFIQNATYKSFEEYLGLAKDVLSIEPAVPQETLDLVMEFRARRNLLLHAQLVVSDRYLASAGPLGKPSSRGKKLKMECDYVADGLAKVSAIVAAIRTTLEAEYSLYTKIHAARELWRYLFQSPIMKFEDYWRFDEVKDHIYAYKSPDNEDMISGSERLILGLWRSHFTYNTRDALNGFNMRLFDETHRTRVLYFLSWAPDFSFE